jgi:hypothetical protein
MRHPIFRKLPLDSFITSSSRLTKSKLQIESIMKYTQPDDRNVHLMPQALNLCQSILYKIDTAIGLATNRLQISHLKHDLSGVLSGLERNQISINDPTRLCLRMGKVMVKRNASESTYFQVALLDNVFVAYRQSKKADAIKVKAVCFLSAKSIADSSQSCTNVL